MRKAAIYVKHLIESPITLESKIEKCREYAAHKDLEVVDTYYDRVRNSSSKLKALQRLLTDFKQHNFECVVIPNISNLTANFVELLKIYKEFKDNDIELLSSIDEPVEAIISCQLSFDLDTMKENKL